jgi:hypothetical protein
MLTIAQVQNTASITGTVHIDNPVARAEPAGGGTTMVSYVAAAGYNQTSTKTSPGQLYGYYAYNNAPYPIFIKFYDLARTPNALVDAPAFVLGLPPSGSAANLSMNVPLSFVSGIAWASMLSIGTESGLTAVNDFVLSLQYI